MSSNLKLLIIEDDEYRIDRIKNLLGEEFYSFDYAKNWDMGFEKISTHEYDIIILRAKLSHTREDAAWLLKKIEREIPEKLNIRYIFFGTSKWIDKSKVVKEILTGREFYFINEDNIDCLYELEWAVINLAPKVFFKYRKILDSLKSQSEGVNENKKRIENLINEQNTFQKYFRDEQKQMKGTFISWENILETVGVLVGAFSVAIGVTIAIILALFNQSIVVNDFGISLLALLIIFIIVIIGSVGFSYLLFKRKAKEIVKEAFRELNERNHDN